MRIAMKPLISKAMVLGALVLAPVAVRADGSAMKDSRAALYQSAQKASQEAITRRTENQIRATALLKEGDAAYAAKDYRLAIDKYRAARTLLEPPAPATAALLNKVYDGLAFSLIELAKEDVEAGRLDDARAHADEAMSVAPNNRRIFEERKAIYWSMGVEVDVYGTPMVEDNPAITPRLMKNIKEVRDLLVKAEDYRLTGQYDAAEKACYDVLKIDPFNSAARKKLDDVVKLKHRYAEKAQQSARAEGMAEVAAGWELPAPREVIAIGQGEDSQPLAGSAIVDLERKLKGMIVAQVNFDQATVPDVIAFLNAKSKELDPAKRGVNFVARLDDASAGAEISLTLGGVPMLDVLKYATQVANLKYRIEEYAVVILPLSSTDQQLLTKEYKVRPDFFNTQVTAGAADAGRGGRGGAAGSRALADAVSISRVTDIKQFLKDKGAQLPDGSVVVYSPGANRLRVRSTPEDLELIDYLLGGSTVTPQVAIETKFVELNQNDFDELSSAMNIVKEGNFTSPVVVGDPLNPASPSSANNMDGLNSLDGLRSSANLPVDSLQGLLAANTAGGVLGRSPNNFNFMINVGGYTFDVLLRTLSQKKSVDLLSAPKVTTRSGENAKIKIIRRFWYPTEYEAPELPNFNEEDDDAVFVGAPPVVEPANPTEFEEKEIGVILDVRPQVGPDNYTIDLDLVPQVIEFEGFINYGTPITIPDDDELYVLTENVINLPVFNNRQIKTSVQVYDQHTVVLGGLIREDVNTIDDKIPLLGDIPGLGRLFRSKVKESTKKNLMIFVTPSLITPTGELLNPPDPVVGRGSRAVAK